MISCKHGYAVCEECAYLAGVRAGLEAAADACVDELNERCVRALDAEAIAKERK